MDTKSNDQALGLPPRDIGLDRKPRRRRCNRMSFNNFMMESARDSFTMAAVSHHSGDASSLVLTGDMSPLREDSIDGLVMTPTPIKTPASDLSEGLNSATAPHTRMLIKTHVSSFVTAKPASLKNENQVLYDDTCYEESTAHLNDANYNQKQSIRSSQRDHIKMADSN